MEKYEKEGYLHDSFRLFHLKDTTCREVKLHYHDFDKILIFRGGNVTYMVEGRAYSLQPGDIVLVNRGDIHKPTVDFSIPYERTILYISCEFLQDYRDESYDLHFCLEKAAREKSYVIRFPGIQQSRLWQALEELEESRKAKAFAWELQTRLLFLEFMICLNRICMGERDVRPTAVYNQKVADLLSYINEHLFEDIHIGQLADSLYLSKYHMMRQFKKETGYTIHRYITEKRIQAAKEKLLSGMPATRVSLECGFQDYSTFLRAFQSCMHMTPTEFIGRG